MVRHASPAKPATPSAPPSSLVRATGDRVRIVRAPTCVSLYANDVRVEVTPWDARLIWGEISQEGSGADRTVLVRQVAEVRLSPPMLKKLAEVLRQQVALYEQRLGPIPLPPDEA